MVLLLAQCTHKRAELGTTENPIKFFLVPSVEMGVLEASAKELKKYLELNTPYKYQVSVPTSYITVVEAFGSNRADVASLNTYGYILAHKKYGTEAHLLVVRHGEDSYKAQIITNNKSGIKNLSDVNGKKFAFVDPSSASGYILPQKLFKDKKIKPKETVFAQRHDNVVSMIYQGQVDAGATFYSPPFKGEIQDARRLVKSQYPDVESKIKIIEFTSSIPNDPIVFRKDLPSEMKNSIKEALIKFVQTEEGRLALEKTFSVTDFKSITDAEYGATIKMFEELSVDVEGLMKK
ncbi:MAG: phosphate/phosphite/phosphonate ABC transporter substrate-binding protein [Bdellovibrionales bacterium]|nr:phosphate/phosphite/phosphonate ABC transporter substrate-binding protein [Bdellovibrionales bacterium]